MQIIVKKVLNGEAILFFCSLLILSLIPLWVSARTYYRSIANNSVTTAKIANGAITTAKIASHTISAINILPGSIGPREIGRGAITTSQIANRTIWGHNIVHNGIGPFEIADGAIGTAELADGSVTSAKIANGAVGTTEIATGAVTSNELANSTITSSKIAADAVSTAAIQTGAVTNGKLAPNAVTSSELASGAVTTNKIANGAVGSAQLGTDAVLDANVADNITVTSSSGVSADVTMGNGATGSFQSVAGDLTLQGNAGSSTSTDPKFLAGMMGALHGSNVTATSNYDGGLIGAYDIQGTNASTYEKGAVLGIIFDNTTTADGAFVAVLDGDSGAATSANAAYTVMGNNSLTSNQFTYGLDLKGRTHDGYQPVTYGAADIRLSTGVVISSGSGAPSSTGASSGNCNLGAGKADFPLGSFYLNTDGGTNTSFYVCTTTNTWTAK